MKNVGVTLMAVFALAIAMASVAIGAQPTNVSAVSSFVDSLSRAVLQEPGSGTVAGVATLPSTATSGDGLMLIALGASALMGGFFLIRKAITDR